MTLVLTIDESGMISQAKTTRVMILFQRVGRRARQWTSAGEISFRGSTPASTS